MIIGCEVLAGLKISLAEGVGFEPTLGLLLSLISSQVPSTTQPPFHLGDLAERYFVGIGGAASLFARPGGGLA